MIVDDARKGGPHPGIRVAPFTFRTIKETQEGIRNPIPMFPLKAPEVDGEPAILLAAMPTTVFTKELPTGAPFWYPRPEPLPVAIVV
jgi:hypothetical protein